MKKIMWTAAVAALVSLVVAIPLMAADVTLTDKDKEFIKKAASGGLMEVELGQAAQTKGKSQTVRDFGARMVKDHGKANEELKQIVTGKGMAVPEQMGAKHEAVALMLKALPASEFDKQYMQHMVSDHVQDIAEFKEAVRTLTDRDLRNFAQKTLPVLEKHLQLARQAAAQVGVAPEKIRAK